MKRYLLILMFVFAGTVLPAFGSQPPPLPPTLRPTMTVITPIASKTPLPKATFVKPTQTPTPRLEKKLYKLYLPWIVIP